MHTPLFLTIVNDEFIGTILKQSAVLTLQGPMTSLTPA